MEDTRFFKTVFTLRSGKSIVSSMTEDTCFKLYNDWVKYNKKKTNIKKKIDDIIKKENQSATEVEKLINDLEKIKTELESFDKIIIEKTKNNKIEEVTAILVSDIVAMQITEDTKNRV